MPRRVLDFDAMWGSDKLAACAEWAQAEYAWVYGLADASGSFELTNLRVIWGRVAAIRHNLTIERLAQVFDEFHDKGLLFIWEHEGKRYGHWSGSDVPGRLPAPSWRMRLERLAPPVPKQQFAEYMARFARGRAALPRGDWSGLNDGLEAAQAQNLNVNLNWNRNVNGDQDEDQDGDAARQGAMSDQALGGTADSSQPHFSNRNSKAEPGRTSCANRRIPQDGKTSLQNPLLEENTNAAPEQPSRQPSRQAVEQQGSALSSGAVRGDRDENGDAPRSRHAYAGATYGGGGYSGLTKAEAVARELMVGRGPCGPVKVKPEALERARLREAARRGSRPP